MFRCLLIALSLFVSTAAFADHPNEVVVNRNKVNKKLSRMDQLLDDALSKKRNKHRDYELQQLRAELAELREYVARQPEVSSGAGKWMPPPPPPAPVVQVQPVSPQQLSQLLNALHREGFSDGKLRVLKTAASSQYFVVAQVKQLLNAFPFSGDKLHAAAILEPRILDAENHFQLYDAFPMSSDKAKLSEVLARR